ncbi:hypothetical protein [Nocardia tengchongensis]|uniref:hypothetical protein n=1 Tax=Nocardia tengchongensis TaxID=2055889 RepID=UPI0036555F88
MEVGEPQPIRGQSIQDRRLDLRSEGADIAEAHIVDQHHDDVGRTDRRDGRILPFRRGIGGGAADLTGETLITTGIVGD